VIRPFDARSIARHRAAGIGASSDHWLTACFDTSAALASAPAEPKNAMREAFVCMGKVKRTLPNRSSPLSRESSNIDSMSTVGNRIKQIRTRLGLKQQALGALAGVSKSAVSQWEREITTPDGDSLLSLHKKKGINPDWVLYGTGEMFVVRGNASDALTVLTPRQKALLGYFSGLTDAQQDDVLRELQDKERLNQEILEQLTLKKAS
jgi:transcriptional regulator with XRE-family HTH domain